MQNEENTFYYTLCSLPFEFWGKSGFLSMVDYIRHKMSVSVLFYAWTIDEAKRVEKLEDLWEDVDFYTFVKETKEEPDSPLVRNPFYYKWLKNSRCLLSVKCGGSYYLRQTVPLIC